MNSRSLAHETHVFSVGAAPMWLSGALAVISVLASALTLWNPGILNGPAAMLRAVRTRDLGPGGPGQVAVLRQAGARHDEYASDDPPALPVQHNLVAPPRSDE